MRSRFLFVAAAALLVGCINTQEQLRILEEYNAVNAVPSASPDYDFSVLIKNLRPLGVDPTLKADRNRLALAYLADRCPAGEAVGETTLATSNTFLGSTSKDYVVRVKC